MEETSEEPAELVERVAALDIGKATLVACARVPHETKPGRRHQEVRTFATTTRSLPGLADWPYCLGVTRVVLEPTSTYRKPPFYLLEESCGCWLVNAREVKHVPGRPKTDEQDGRLAGQAGRAGHAAGKLRAAAVAAGGCGTSPATGVSSPTSGPARSSVRSRLMGDTQVELSAVASDTFGVSGRQVLEALTAGQRDPKALAQLAQGRMRSKTGVLEQGRSPGTSALTTATCCG